MKSKLLFAITTVLAMVFLPISCLSLQSSPTKELEISANVQNVTAEKTYFRVYRAESKKIEKISVSDYLCGVLAAEMPVSYEKEALKAQAVAARTYTIYQISKNNEKHP